jgi:hypothetical protein
LNYSVSHPELLNSVETRMEKKNGSGFYVSATLNFSTPLRLLSKIHKFLSEDGEVFPRTLSLYPVDLLH